MLARSTLADPDYALKVCEGRPETIVKCVRDNTCMRRMVFGMPVRCDVNPAMGREARTSILPPLGSASGSLGTNDIIVGANGAIETLYDLNSSNANLIVNGRMFLHQHHTFRTATVAGASPAPTALLTLTSPPPSPRCIARSSLWPRARPLICA